MAKKNWKAAQAITEHVRTTERLLSRLEEKLANMRHAAQDCDVHWGHAATAEHTLNQVLDILVGFEVEPNGSEEETAERILRANS